MDLSIVIVSWNVKEKLKENLKAIFASDHSVSFEVFVVDNNSADGTVQMVRDEFTEVKLIANEENVGFAKANNQAIKLCQSDYILLLNPDMKPFPDTFKNMVQWMRQNQNVDVAGCKLLDEKNEIVKHVRRFPKFLDQLAIVLKLPHLLPSILDNYLRVDFDYNKAEKVDSIRGGFFIIRRETIEKTGLLDEQFFIWFEEVDYCKRVAEVGGEVWYTNAAECIDYVGQSFSQVKRNTTQIYFRDSMLKYFKKWQPIWEYRLLKLAWPLGLFITRILNYVRVKGRART
ncbi:MAG: Glycosyl transferase family 2 [Parcubacteria group bacterium GW2011_GWE2_39_37]|uniref:Glycosyl transferase family 2 n=1 Tax=Candidatus Falkowbacteria bacterium GW2011_GWF2_39_8 TaxID=1618642 RepID=A0A0G0T4F0_9BACT|nr:MAG: Glycosyl transferase family 2 [Parcubacteria group bacterium GW2011_GWE2_39_37]KKR32672.1 MAG: Glycosyl transferase family 2 [Candidatus Falkowbacteria bacterium GW2011_GWF2_39_8]